MFGKILVTHQTGPEGKEVKRIYIQEAYDIEKELYLSCLVDRETSKIAFISSTEGGMDIEKVAEKNPEKITTTKIDLKKTLSSEDIEKTWHKCNKIQRENDSFLEKDDLFVDIPNNLPALLRATKMQQRASELEYDFPTTENALDKIHEEISELKDALNTKDSRHIEEEIGDVLFSLANLSRKLSLDPEKALRLSIDKFVVRINSALAQIKEENLTNTELESKKLDEIWNLVKRAQGKKNE